MAVVVKKFGNGLAVIFPREMARQMKLSDGTSLQITQARSAIILRKLPQRARRSLIELVAQINPASYRRRNRELFHQSSQDQDDPRLKRKAPHIPSFNNF